MNLNAQQRAMVRRVVGLSSEAVAQVRLLVDRRHARYADLQDVQRRITQQRQWVTEANVRPWPMAAIPGANIDVAQKGLSSLLVLESEIKEELAEFQRRTEALQLDLAPAQRLAERVLQFTGRTVDGEVQLRATAGGR